MRTFNTEFKYSIDTPKDKNTKTQNHKSVLCDVVEEKRKSKTQNKIAPVLVVETVKIEYKSVWAKPFKHCVCVKATHENVSNLVGAVGVFVSVKLYVRCELCSNTLAQCAPPPRTFTHTQTQMWQIFIAYGCGLDASNWDVWSAASTVYHTRHWRCTLHTRTRMCVLLLWRLLQTDTCTK